METIFLKIFYDSLCDRLLQIENLWGYVESVYEVWKVYSNIDWTYRYVYRVTYSNKDWYNLREVKKTLREFANKNDF